MNNKKRSRAIAAALVLMLAIFSMAGCSLNDAGFMSLYMEYSKLQAFTQTADLSVEINPDAMNTYSSEKADPIKVKLNMTANGKQTDEEIYFDVKIKYGVNDSKMPYEADIIFTDNTLLMPVADYVEINDIINGLSGLSDKMCADIRAELEKQLSAYDYISIDLMEMTGAMYGQTTLSMGLVTASNEMMELMVNSITQMFKNLDSGMTKQVANGYALEITPDNAIALFEKGIKYAEANKKDIYNGSVSLLEGLKKYYTDEMQTTVFDALIGELTDNEQQFYDSIDQIVSGYAEMDEYTKEMMTLALKGSYIKETLTKSGKNYNSDMDINIAYMGNKVFSAKGQTKTTSVESIEQQHIDVSAPIDLESLIAITDKAVNKVNHATKMDITWWNGQEGWMSADIQLVEGEKWDYMEGMLENGSLYLPMRVICEWFGEDVTWDNSAKKAYVDKDGQKIELEGKLEYSTTYVKIREFEKLGYKVNYEYDKEYKEHRVTIEQ